jgi:hypothetical protein
MSLRSGSHERWPHIALWAGEKMLATGRCRQVLQGQCGVLGR